MKSTSKNTLKNKCDAIFKEIVLLKAENKCEVCGSSFGITAHHFIPRSLAGHLIYYLPNGICLCRGCHFAHHHKSDPKISSVIIEKRGKKWLKDLETKRKEKHFSYKSLQWYQDNYNRLTKALNKLK